MCVWDSVSALLSIPSPSVSPLLEESNGKASAVSRTPSRSSSVSAGQCHRHQGRIVDSYVSGPLPVVVVPTGTDGDGGFVLVAF